MAQTANQLLNTSVEDCACSLRYINDMELLNELLERCFQLRHKTRATVVARRIRQLEREVAA